MRDESFIRLRYFGCPCGKISVQDCAARLSLARRAMYLGRYTMPDSEKCKVLLVEDDADTAETIAKQLVMLNFTPRVTRSRDEAASLLPKFKPQAILMDYKMPGMSASVFIKRCRTLLPKSKIVMITAVRDGPSLAKLLDVDSYFGKPLDLEGIADFLATLT